MSQTDELVRSATGTSAADTGGWWRKPFSVFQTNLQEIDATMDVEAVLDVIEAQGATTWLINTGGISSFYPTDLPYQTRIPFLIDRPSGDLIGDAVKAAKARGIRVLSRLDFSKVAPRIAREHPEWLFVSPKGAPQIYNTLYSTCPSRPYYQERSLDILDEVIDRYEIDGFFFNWFDFSEMDYSRVYHGVCHCDDCHAGFAAYAGGKALPDGPGHPHYSEWLAFADEVATTLCAKIATHISNRRADAALVLKRGAPIVYYEANNAFGREPWHHNTSENVSAHMTGLPEVSLLVNSVSFVDMPYRMSGEQPEMFAQYLLQAIARGGNPSTYIMGAPGRIPYANLPEAARIEGFHRDHHDVYTGLQPASNIALVRPNPVRRADPTYARSVSEYRGLYSGLVEANLPFDTLSEEFLTKIAVEGRLDAYQMVILPDRHRGGRCAGWLRSGGRPCRADRQQRHHRRGRGRAGNRSRRHACWRTDDRCRALVHLCHRCGAGRGKCLRLPAQRGAGLRQLCPSRLETARGKAGPARAPGALRSAGEMLWPRAK
ncbi:beta-galactosidase [Roseicyclus sp. F158]|uniref:Beta-galactosidase n=1 Tax=Tropicimonas omnivorans TaxID=3075590 RepID=A0ABU3DFH8_9RHOB|nr:beta-galactosidase [Roseicyclus sp. F158]MDT0682319.1 beta-galactosidase [Roseicyclus sp. F158]